jgi:hypothetical protein
MSSAANRANAPFLGALALLGAPPRAPAGLGLGLLGGLLAPPVVSSGPSNWVAVWPRFETFHQNILLTPPQVRDGRTKFAGVVAALNAHYYGSASQGDTAFYFGSWGKDTATRPPRDVDIYFRLPPHVYGRFEARAGNRQSALLQEVKDVLRVPYPRTDIRGDGQVVVIPFESYAVEVVPAFMASDGRCLICDTHDGGGYQVTDPLLELHHLNAEDKASGGDLRRLIRMVKTWQAFRKVPIESFQLELVAVNFMQQSPWRGRGWFWFDWLVRDFFAYLIAQANSYVFVPGTSKPIFLGDGWLSRAQTAYGYAIEACANECDNFVYLAGGEWQKIFGGDIPLGVPT